MKHYGLFALVLVAVLVGAAGQAGATQQPSLHASAPATVKNESSWNVSASGYSGPYNTVTESWKKGAVSCGKPWTTFSFKKTTTVKKQHSFNVTFSLAQVAEIPETRTLCFFLYRGSSGKFLVETLRYQI